MLNQQSSNGKRRCASLIARHVRQVYSCLSQFQHGKSEISTCVQISIEPESAFANKACSFPMSKGATSGTELGSIIWLNLPEPNTFSFSFVLDKVLKLMEAPITYPSVYSFSPVAFTDSFEVFHHNLRWPLLNDSLADVVINPNHKPFFSARNFFKKSLCRSCAFGLEFITQILESPFDRFNVPASIECSIGGDCQIIYPEINTQHQLLVRSIDVDFFAKTEQKEAATFPVNGQQGFSHVPGEIFLITSRDFKWNPDSSLDREDVQKSPLQGCASWEIVSYCSSFNNGFAFRFLQHSAGLLDARNSQLCRQSNGAEMLINERVQLDIVMNIFLPTKINAMLHCFLINGDRFVQFSSSFNPDFGSCPYNHNDRMTENNLYSSRACV